MKYLIFSFLLLIPIISLAANTVYEPLVGLPGVDEGADFNTYVNSIYALSITIAALLAVIKIVIAGVKWMLTDVVTSKEEAKKDIKGALFGLLIVLAAVLIISVINKDILEVDLTFQPVPAPAQTLNMTNNTGANAATQAGTTVGASSAIKKTNTCPTITGSNGLPTSDCAGLVSACESGGGVVADQGIFGNNKITCYAPSLPNTTIGKYTDTCGMSANGFTVDCSGQIAFCKSKGGVAEIVGISGNTIDCYAP